MARVNTGTLQHRCRKSERRVLKAKLFVRVRTRTSSSFEWNPNKFSHAKLCLFHRRIASSRSKHSRLLSLTITERVRRDNEICSRYPVEREASFDPHIMFRNNGTKYSSSFIIRFSGQTYGFQCYYLRSVSIWIVKRDPDSGTLVSFFHSFSIFLFFSLSLSLSLWSGYICESIRTQRYSKIRSTSCTMSDNFVGTVNFELPPCYTTNRSRWPVNFWARRFPTPVPFDSLARIILPSCVFNYRRNSFQISPPFPSSLFILVDR